MAPVSSLVKDGGGEPTLILASSNHDMQMQWAMDHVIMICWSRGSTSHGWDVKASVNKGKLKIEKQTLDRGAEELMSKEEGFYRRYVCPFACLFVSMIMFIPMISTHFLYLYPSFFSLLVCLFYSTIFTSLSTCLECLSVFQSGFVGHLMAQWQGEGDWRGEEGGA